MALWLTFAILACVDEFMKAENFNAVNHFSKSGTRLSETKSYFTRCRRYPNAATDNMHSSVKL